MYPDVDRGDGQKRVEAGGNTLPTHNQTTIFLLKPSKRPLRLESGHHFFDRSAPVFLRFPDALGNLRPNTPLPELLPERFRIIPLIRRDDLEPFAGTPPFPGVNLDRIEQRHHLGPLIPVGRRGAVRQGHPTPLGEAVDKDPLAFPPVGDALAATLPRGKKRHQRRHTPNESSRVPRQSRVSALASRPGCHPPATAATSDAWRSSTPIA